MQSSARKEESLVPVAAGKVMALHALVVDDNEMDRKRLRRLCRKAGLKLEVAEATDIDTMRRKLDLQRFDLIFLDYHLEFETGLDALAEVVSHPKQGQAISIMVTSVDSHDVIIDAMKSGCSDYLIKDEISPDMIRKSISTAIERRILMAAIAEERALRESLRGIVERFSDACAPEMRAIMSAMLRRVRSARGTGSTDTILADNLLAMERSCKEVFQFLEDLGTVLDRPPGDASAIARQLAADPAGLRVGDRRH